MSHLKEREEKICLNCGTALTDRYCQHCGQENLEPKESLGHLLKHFFSDVTHFDGKFFVTIKYLFIRPGFLTVEYIKGKRARYLNPIRMFLFVSTVFFLLKMSVFNHKDILQNAQANAQANAKARARLDTMRNSGFKTAVAKTALSTAATLDSIGKRIDTSQHEFEAASVAQYDSQQAALPKEKRDKGLDRVVSRKMAAFSESRKSATWKEKQHMMEATFYHSLPYMLFLSVPLIALLFKLIYIRRKQFYYVTHTIFTVHYFCLVYLFLILRNGLELQAHWGDIVSSVLTLIQAAYLYIAMLSFYQQGWFKTFVKFLIILCFGYLIVFMLMGIAWLIAAWEVF